ncbi:metallophosphoesterase [candidate division KSB1 bacterium]|nr:metallophosphoesterase [candidate division KSB1 bacterium]
MKIFKVIVALLCIGLLSLIYGYFIERKNIKIEYVNIRSEKFSENFSGVRIVHISDLHLKSLTAYEKDVAAEINDVHPDIIAITGDFFRHRNIFEGFNAVEKLPKSIDQVKNFLHLLHAPYGVFICRGNNDFGDDKEVSNIFLDAMHRDEVNILVNSSSLVTKDNERIHLLGIDFPGFSRWEANEFSNRSYEDGRCMESWFSFENSYSHFLLGPDREKWSDYTYTGSLRQSNPDEGGIGLIFYSQFDLGYDAFYRLRRLAGWSKFVLSPHAANRPLGETECQIDMLANQWYRFKIRCFSKEDGTHIQAKVWPKETEEPAQWQADAVDTTHQFQNGTVGLWSHGKGLHQFDDLCVFTANGDTLMVDDFEDRDTFGWVDFNFEAEAIPWIRQAIPDSEFTVLLAHTPDVIAWADSAKIDLQLSGHTHGGQIQLPLLGPLVTGTDLGRKYAQGLFSFDHTTLFVTRGIGTILLPIRLFCRPEIVVIDLTAK